MRTRTLLAVSLLAVLIGVASLAGILVPSTYARDSANWAAQGVGQDWADLLLLVPTLILSGLAARRGSRRARLILAGALVYSTYTFVLYAFTVHFNALFLVYCAVLGLSVFGGVSLARRFLLENVKLWFVADAPVKLLGGLLVVSGALFGVLWLSEDIPALLLGAVPTSVILGGLVTNPVHVLDLSLALPAMIGGGVALLLRRPVGYVLAPVMAVFSVLMSFTLAILFVVMQLAGQGPNLALAWAMGAVGVVTLTATAGFLRALRPHTHHEEMREPPMHGAPAQ